MIRKMTALFLGLMTAVFAVSCTDPHTTEPADTTRKESVQPVTADNTETRTEPVTQPSEKETVMPTESQTSDPAPTKDAKAGDQLIPGSVADIRKFTEKDIAYLRQLFKNSVIAGDSRVQAITEYGILGEDVCISLYGGYAGNSKEIAEQAANLFPEKVLFFMGINDPKWYYDDYETFLKDYKADIDAYKAINPYSDIYVCNLIQVSEKRQSEVEAFKLVPEYNKRLEALCAQEGWHYIDGNRYLKTAYYLEDGSHFTEEFYCYLIQQFASEMGLWE